MKKAWIPWIIIAVLGLAVAFMGGYLLAGGKTPASTPASASALTADVIDENAAKAIALAHANVSESDVSLLHVKRDQENGRSAYDVDFVKDGAEYEYKINAADGAVLSYDCDADKSPVPPAAASSSPSSAASSSVPSTAQSTAQPAKYVGEDDAKAAAFAHAGVSEKDASFLQISFDTDDGRAEYDIEFRKGFTEYDYKIDAATGKVLNYEVDSN